MKFLNLILLSACLNEGVCVAEEVRLPRELRPIANMESRTSNPSRDPGLFGDYWWANRFLSRHAIVESWRGKTVDVVLLGDSIIHFWEWKHSSSWNKFVQGKKGVLNLGYGGDRTENLIWRIEHGELDGYDAKNIVLLIGTNNNTSKTTNPTNVAMGVEKIVSLIRRRQPKAKLFLLALLPRGASETSSRHSAARKRNEITNVLLKEFAMKDGRIVWVDICDRFLDDGGWVPASLMADEIHPTEKGYDILIEELSKVM